MLRSIALAGATLVLIGTLVGCGSTTSSEPDNSPVSADGASAPAAAADFEGKQFEDVADELTKAGFEEVKVEALGDLITGWLDEPGEVDAVVIDGADDFDAGDVFSPNAEVLISYHSFPEDQSETDEVMTVESSAELAELLAGPESGSSVEAFAERYGGGATTITFDAHVTYLLKSERHTYSTAVLAAGDAGGPATGPLFEISPLLIPDSSPLQQDDLAEGMNVRITGEVGYFKHHDATTITDEVNQLTLLPVALEKR